MSVNATVIADCSLKNKHNSLPLKMSNAIMNLQTVAVMQKVKNSVCSLFQVTFYLAILCFHGYFTRVWHEEIRSISLHCVFSVGRIKLQLNISCECVLRNQTQLSQCFGRVVLVDVALSHIHVSAAYRSRIFDKFDTPRSEANFAEATYVPTSARFLLRINDVSVFLWNFSFVCTAYQGECAT